MLTQTLRLNFLPLTTEPNHTIMINVKQILDNKGFDFFSIKPDATVFEALQLMADKNVGALMVLDADGKLAGFFVKPWKDNL